ncbi:endonuclease domain-containing protein [Notoacmeibacter sp. MSK16QG-6]|uniref:endonuclease domain-containing protein n=1 Tax=Notoacmeibacter sp. MSK16QG-6 TaxID=2957982 RepID=UPI0020A16E75|nr:DUF559 domain-containing protein [Notoacmeibacter sp. MSK16QG-6]MCP1198969.1 DUF559 domain-containing protein [Notoacmeibacter sp. MSK16QG-6]
MSHKSSDQKLKFARQMRRDPTPAENALWQMLRGRKLGGLKFRRQQPLGPFIVDFVCMERRLIVEADGGQHAGSRSDAERDTYFRMQGYHVLRFWNDEIFQNSEGVAQHILKIVRSDG